MSSNDHKLTECCPNCQCPVSDHTLCGCLRCSCLRDPVGDRLAAQAEHAAECRDREDF